jgi:hypothetical protein
MRERYLVAWDFAKKPRRMLHRVLVDDFET